MVAGPLLPIVVFIQKSFAHFHGIETFLYILSIVYALLE